MPMKIMEIVIGVKYSDDDKKLASTFEKLDFNEKLDVFS